MVDRTRFRFLRVTSGRPECDTLELVANKRHSPPLFEVLERQGGRVDRPQGTGPSSTGTETGHPAAAVASSAPVAAPVPTTARSVPATSPEPGPAVLRGELRVPLAGVWTAVVVAVGVAFVTWTIGYNVGFGNGQTDQASALGIGSGRIQDPLNTDYEAGQMTGERNAERNSSGGTRTSPSGSGLREPAGVTLVLDGAGREGPDPRREGHNYLALAILEEPAARSAVRYLANEGVRTIAVPVDLRTSGVDSRSNSGNNPRPVSYELFSMDLEVPSGSFRESEGQRQALVDRVALIGRQWLQNGGASDFSKPQWKRYDGP